MLASSEGGKGLEGAVAPEMDGSARLTHKAHSASIWIGLYAILNLAIQMICQY